MDAYRNPIARGGDFADPFVLRHDGRYYLYCTNPDIRCWSSADLVQWRLEGPAIAEDEFPGLVPFAPEVVYADGAFYMYTSPSGHGHYVLRADSPTGPFRRISDNVGHAIDGNVLIDDDGRWYFYWAGDEGIWGCEMGSPAEFGEPVLTGVHMNGWTEGPFVSKRDGRYHMTLTGNHYLSAGYRIDAAWSRHPLQGWVADPLNPVLISTEGARVGLGHSSSVRGPDLVSTYLVYHNLNPDESRDLDLDRQVWSGRSLQVLGPSASAPLPAAPDFRCDWSRESSAGWQVRNGELEILDGTALLTGRRGRAVWETATTTGTFTAEVNLTASRETSAYGVSLEAADGRSSLALRIDRDTHAISAVDSEKDAILGSAPLPRSFAHDALHCWFLISTGDEMRLFLDGRMQLSLPFRIASGSAIAVLCADGAVRIGHCALSGTIAIDADRAAVKPVPGRFWAALAPDAPTVADDAGDPRGLSVPLGPETSLSYDLHVHDLAEAAVLISGDFAAGDALEVCVDDGEEREILVDEATVVVSAPIELPRRRHALRIRGRRGTPSAALVAISPRPANSEWRTAGARLEGYGKLILDPALRLDFTLSASLSLTFGSPGSHGDLILRASQLAEGGAGDDSRLGIDFLLGYSVQLHADRVVLARHDYDERVLAVREMPINGSAGLSLTVRVAGGGIRIDLEGAEPIRVQDPFPHLLGGVGIRTSDAGLRIESLEIAPIPSDRAAKAAAPTAKERS